MVHDNHAVSSAVNVELYRFGPVAQGFLECRDGVFGERPVRATVGYGFGVFMACLRQNRLTM
jgi:hypothetical protein